MAYRIIKTSAEESWVKLSGVLTVHDFLALQALAKDSLERSGGFRVLVELENFQGWSKESGWENTSFLPERGEQSAKIAFVGDEKWKDDIFMFIGKPMRDAAIEFFPHGRLADAQAWLSASG